MIGRRRARRSAPPERGRDAPGRNRTCATFPPGVCRGFCSVLGSRGGRARELLELHGHQRWLSADALEHWLITAGFARYAGPGQAAR